MKIELKILSIILGGLLAGCLVIGCDQKPENSATKIPGSYRSLELMSNFRAYPNQDMPNDAYSKAFDHINLKMQRISNRTDNHWEAMGPAVTAGRTLTVAVNPQAELTVYAGSASGGLWRSRNLGLGNTWKRMETGFPVLGVSTIEFAPQDSSVMLIGTGEVYNIEETGNDGAYRATRGSYGIGILKSTDGGSSWSKTLDWSYEEQHGVWMIKMAPSNPDVVYAATTKGIYRSLDKGDNWDLVFEKLLGTDIDVDPNNPSIAVASFGNFDSEGKGIFYTFDGGITWEESTGVPTTFNGKILLARSASDSNIMYASVGNGFSSSTGFTWLLKSLNGGIDWEIINTTDYSRWQGWFSHDVAVHPTNPDELIAIGIDVHKSEDGGTSLEQKSNGGVTLGDIPSEGPDGPPNYSHSDHHFVMYHPTIEDLVLLGNDGGLFLSYDAGESFRSANVGYQSTQFYNGFSVSPINPNLALGGLQDNSTSIFRGTDNWQRAIGGDGSWTGVSAFDEDVFFGSAQYLNMVRTTNGGQNFVGVAPPGQGALFIAPFVVSKAQEGLLFAGARNVYISENNAQSWSTTSPLNGNSVYAMDASDIDANVLYVATVPDPDDMSSRPEVFSTQDKGETWQSVSFDLPNFIPNDIQVYPEDPSSAIIVFSGFGGSHVFRTNNYGETWEDIHGNLPSIPTNAVAINPNNIDQIFIGNDLNVFISNDAGASYQIYDEGLPNALIVLDLKISPIDQTLWIASHGNGAYRRPLEESNPVSVEEVQEVIVNVFPNPTSDIINVELSQGQVGKLQLFDMSGRLTLSSAKKNMISVGHLSAGNYLLKIGSENLDFIEKISIQ